MNYGIELAGIAFDTMVASYLLAPNERRHNMDDLAEKYLNYTHHHLQGAGGHGQERRARWRRCPSTGSRNTPSRTPISPTGSTRYSERKIEEEELAALFHDIEMPLVPVLADMERAGVKIDTAHFKKLEAKNREMLGRGGGEDLRRRRAGRSTSIPRASCRRSFSTSCGSSRSGRPRPGSPPTSGCSSPCRGATRSSTT